MRNADSIEESKAARQPAIRRENKQAKVARIAPWQWKPGQSGNPSGRPKNDLAREIAKAVFENNTDALYMAYSKALLKGNAYAFKELADRAYGKLKEVRELTGKDGGPIETREVSDAELNERIKQLERDLGLAREIDEAGRVGLAAAGTTTATIAHEDQ